MTYIAERLRRQVYERATGHCEYCLLDERYTILRHEVDHIYAEKHGGQSTEVNLCLSCAYCNRYKGTDICSLDPETGLIAVLFHPRQAKWSDHFRLAGAMIEPRTPSGRVTVRLFRLNDRDRIIEREALIRLNRYP